MANRLAGESSPYLLQHAENPIDWFPWGDEAFEKARREDKPVFLSVGYSSCHWCHVMAHESFEDQEVADVLNRAFVSIKLDREERPDIDEAYMTAVQMSTGHGGWPMSVFMTPDRRPFFAGTYFPRQGRGQVPGFLTILSSLAQSWAEKRSEVELAAGQFAEALTEVRSRSMAPATSLPSIKFLDEAVQVLHQDFDYEQGGFGQAPKFPPHSAIRFLLQYAGIRGAIGVEGEADDLIDAAAAMALMSLERICLGGIHDHAGGGFHRYSTDAQWLLPHFEKMLYDNGQMLWSLSLASALLEDAPLAPLLRRSALGIAGWVEREMTSPEGFFYSALDADSEGEEGLFYTWPHDDLVAVVGEEWALKLGSQPSGNFLDEATQQPSSRNILHQTVVAESPELNAALEKLRIARETRVRPGLDHKALLGWNGLMIGALARLGRVDLASRSARAWLDVISDGQVPHQVVNGVASGAAYLDDIACFIDALLELAEVTQEEEWLRQAHQLADEMLADFSDPERPGLFFAPNTLESLFGRTKPYFDNASPSPNGVAVRALLRMGRFEDALPHLLAAMPWAARMPQATETVLESCLLWVLMQGAQEPAPVAVPPAPAAQLKAEDIRVSMTPREIRVDSEGWGHTLVTIELPDGVHINSNEPPARWLTPTSLKVEGLLGEAGFPESENDRYEGTVNLPVRLRAKSKTEEFELTVTFQACTEQECLAPQSRTFAGVVLVP